MGIVGSSDGSASVGRGETAREGGLGRETVWFEVVGVEIDGRSGSCGGRGDIAREGGRDREGLAVGVDCLTELAGVRRGLTFRG